MCDREHLGCLLGEGQGLSPPASALAETTTAPFLVGPRSQFWEQGKFISQSRKCLVTEALHLDQSDTARQLDIQGAMTSVYRTRGGF